MIEKKDKDSLEMTNFKFEDFTINTSEKYRSCVMERNPLSASTLTQLYIKGWKVISFSGYSKLQDSIEVFTYLFENLNYDKKELV